MGPARLLHVATTLSFVADGARFAATPLVAAAAGAGPRAVSLLFVCGTAPWLIVGPYAGTLVDRVSRRTLLRAADGVRVVLGGALAFVVATGDALVPALLVFSFAFGAVETVYDLAGATAIPLLGDAQLERLNARYTATQLLGRELAGPVAGAALVAAASTAPFAAGTAAYAVAVVAWRSFGRVTTEPARKPVADRAPWWSDARAGAAFLLRSPALRTLALVSAIGNGAFMASQSTVVLFVTRHLDASGLWYSAVLAAPAVGGLAGSALATRVVSLVGHRRTCAVAAAAGAGAYAVAAVANSVLLLVAGFAALGIAFMLWNVAALSLRQRLVPDELRGRAESFYRLVSWGALPAGAIVGGALASAFGLRAPFVFAAATTAAAALVLPLGAGRGVAAHAAGDPSP